ncbi:hypothetical protein D3C80_1164330 [compost metagenome]
MFQGVGQASITRCLVAGADLVPDLGNYHGRTVVFAHDHLQAIVESEFVGGLRVGSQGRKGQANCAEQQACGAAGKSIHSFSNLWGCPLVLSVSGREGARILIRFTGGHAYQAFAFDQVVWVCSRRLEFIN